MLVRTSDGADEGLAAAAGVAEEGLVVALRLYVPYGGVGLEERVRVIPPDDAHLLARDLLRHGQLRHRIDLHVHAVGGRPLERPARKGLLHHDRFTPANAKIK